MVIVLLAGVWYFCHRARWLPKAVQYTKVEAYKRAAARRKAEVKKTAKTGARREAYAVRGYRDEDESATAERKKSAQKGRRLSKSKGTGNSSSRSPSRSPSRSGSEDNHSDYKSAAGGNSKETSRRGSVITRRSSATNDQTPLLGESSSQRPSSRPHTPEASRVSPTNNTSQVANPLQRNRVRRGSHSVANTSAPVLGASDRVRPISYHAGATSYNDSPGNSPHTRRATQSNGPPPANGQNRLSSIQPSRQSRLSMITANAASGTNTPTRRPSVLEDLPPAYTDQDE